MKLRDTQFGFDLVLDNPFRIFRYLREVAIESVGEENIIDLSRGDPGYGFSPSVGGREFYSFLLMIDAMLNRPGEHFVTNNRDSHEILWKKIEERANTVYRKDTAERLLGMLRTFLNKVEKIAAMQGLSWDRRKILFEMFKYSAVSGGQYHDPQGEILTRLIVSNHHNETFGLGITHRDLVCIRGVSDGIGTLFKLLCSDEVGFLQKGDAVLITSPVYAPYNTIMKNRGLEVYSVSVNPTTGKVNGSLSEMLANAPKNVKAICIIDPNNPTGFLFEENFLKEIAEFAKKRDALIIADEVYGDFFPGKKKNMMTYAPKRTITMLGRSKIERSTGLRFAEYIVSQEADAYISREILKGRLNGNPDLKSLLIAGKAPGGINGEFQHTTFVAGPSQFLGISHILFGESDRKDYVERVQKNMEEFYEGIGLPYLGNFYYATFDLLNVTLSRACHDSPESLFLGLAKKGVVLIPANLFFSDSERALGDYRTFARASLANLNMEQVQRGAFLIKEILAFLK
ncbi:pyridoxal phosphate-dependent aminotransferase [Candidatus Peregrinibacteria bacterium]|nr:pyridoxal phosphate-dependent aminotransferase [Candidatus Peregrinibacteria bacterium]